jgi:pyruvate kinase
VPIIALTPFIEVQRRLALSWGVTSRLIRKVETTDEMIEEVEATLLSDGAVRANDVIVIISGSPMWVRGTTNLLKLHRVGERRT